MNGKNAALLIIDIQTASFLEEQPLFKDKELVSNNQLLISKARMAGIPVFFTKHDGKTGMLNQKGSPGWNIHPSMTLKPEDIIIEKNHPDAFQQTSLQQELTSRYINQLIITGIQTEICVDATCRRAYSLGYDVILVADGHSTYDSIVLKASQIINHHNSVHAQWFASVVKTKDIIF
ncbi:cysteine hydrolase family protein [Bacillus massiliigorillae]|uniref:cysteine hydrolase family protein n=1 Tax=Bacillus massiliigorillae TaxID=1243664 RepID=UPI0005A8EA43|nr:cysteine hydrolase family protein [Bacillus massiliigorillae]